MIYGVKIFDSKGQLKQDLTKEELEARHWNGFHFDVTPYAVSNKVARKGYVRKVKPVRKIKCAICGAEFLSSHVRARYCNRKCVKVSKLMKTDKHYFDARRVADRARYEEGKGWRFTCQWHVCDKVAYKFSATAKYCSPAHGYKDRNPERKTRNFR